MIVKNNTILRDRYDDLKEGDIVVGRVSCRPEEEYILYDLLDRGIQLIPSGLAQLICRSKAFQLRVFSSWMIPGSSAVHDIHQLQEVLQEPDLFSNGVVTKLDRKNAGLGVHRWGSLEDVFNQASLGVLAFPFVVQPFMDGCRDIRVVVLGDYAEAYWRHNKKNFRNNIHFGAQSEPCELDSAQVHLCQEVMKRGKFPYAHIDLLVTPAGKSYLTEINLRGGIKGAKISPAEYKKRLENIHAALLQ